MSVAISVLPDVFSRCSTHSAAVSGNWLSTAIAPAGLTSHPMVPPARRPDPDAAAKLLDDRSDGGLRLLLCKQLESAKSPGGSSCGRGSEKCRRVSAIRRTSYVVCPCVARHQGRDRDAVDHDRRGHDRQGDVGQRACFIAREPMGQRVGQVIERSDTADAEPADDRALPERGPGSAAG